MQSEITHKVLVRAMPEAGFPQIFRGGFGWPKGETLKEISSQTLKALQEDTKHFLVREITDEAEFEANRERLGITLSKEEILQRENNELRARVAKGEAAFEVVAEMKDSIGKALSELNDHFHRSMAEMSARIEALEAKAPLPTIEEVKPEPKAKKSS